MQILKLLEKSPVVAFFEVLDFKDWSTGSYSKLSVAIIDDTILHIREYIDEKERHYSFHWQDKNDCMICRWDNAWHHRNIKTFPHHKHNGDEVGENYEIYLKDVLCYIEKALSRK